VGFGTTNRAQPGERLRRNPAPLPAEVLARRQFLHAAVASASALALAPGAADAASDPLVVENITRLYSVRVGRIVRPRSTEDIQKALADWPGQVSVGGALCSMGGQTAIGDGLHLDLRGMNALVWLKPEQKRARMQAGMRWRELQALIDPHDLSVRTMQSFANFTVGGSVSVNVHGRYVGHGPMAGSIRALQLVLADGHVVEASREENADLFRAAIGGYGALGVISEVELDLDSNARIERVVEPVSLEEYPDWYARNIRDASDAILHNADLYPPSFESPLGITWRLSDRELTVVDRLRPANGRYLGRRSAIWAVTELPGGMALRERVIAPKQFRKAEVVWRNFEASLDIRELEPFTRFMSTYALQEYFIPISRFAPFVESLRRIVRQHDAEVLNLSIRHSPADAHTLMAWAREEVFSFVLYYKQRVLTASQRRVRDWTRELVAAALDMGGTYYLPYQPHATREQFRRAYPRAAEFAAVKAIHDPAGRFSNEMWRNYLDW
jgi:FAD/FMN-containing dehydrogenase